MARLGNLEDVYEVVRTDDRWEHLRDQPGIRMIPGEGQAEHPEAMVVVGAPGATENTKRRPILGLPGKVLIDLMGSAGLYTSDWQDDERKEYGVANAFITNVVKYRLPGGRVPNLVEIMAGAEALRREWLVLGQPRLIVAVGSPARAALLPAGQQIAPGQFAALPDGRTFVWVQYHPSFGLQHPEAQPEMEKHWERMGEWNRNVKN